MNKFRHRILSEKGIRRWIVSVLFVTVRRKSFLIGKFKKNVSSSSVVNGDTLCSHFSNEKWKDGSYRRSVQTVCKLFRVEEYNEEYPLLLNNLRSRSHRVWKAESSRVVKK